MNRHFQRDAHWEMPSGVFARLDDMVPPAPDSNTTLLAFDAIDANWIEQMGTRDPRFYLNDPEGIREAWRENPGHRGQENPFEYAPLYRIEVEFPQGAEPFGFPVVLDHEGDDFLHGELQTREDAWFYLEISRDRNRDRHEALVYPGLFAPPVLAYVAGTMASAQQGKALSGIFSLATLPTITANKFAKHLAKGSADYLAAYDVGQGNSNALLAAWDSSRAIPTLYYDLGAGVYRNQHTTPKELVFCFTEKPPIVLSHWDADHWAGTYANSVNGKYPALEQTWITPMQRVGPVHVAFAHDVIANGGTVYTYAPKKNTIGVASLKSGQQLRFTIGTGSDRNNTGIVLSIENQKIEPPRSWLLTGDCDYPYFVPHLAPLPPVALVAPHHGATLSPKSGAPEPWSSSENAYRRLIYSFGAGNKHGRTNVQHPTTAGVSLHESSGWLHGNWTTPPGTCIAGADVLETEVHGTTGSLGGPVGGCLIGWISRPPSVISPCGSTACSVSPVRS